MKELSIEEKAKRYDKAIEIAKEINNEQRAQPFNVMTKVFPELKESEDERIRKALKDYFINSFQNNGVAAICGVHIKDILAWLEKQGEQKPAWSEEDERSKNAAIQACKYMVDNFENSTKQYDDAINWLKSLKERVQPQPKQEWSEEDETGLTNAIIMLKEGASLHFNKNDITKAVDFLKSLKDRYTWKPSDEQMITLRHVISGCSYDIEPLVELETKLKEL